MDSSKKLYKSNQNKMIDGVCGGIGEYFDIDPTLVRLGFVFLCALAGGGLLAYIVALIIIPRAPEGYDPAAHAAKESPQEPPKKAPSDAPEAESAHPPANSAEDGDDAPTLI